MRKQIIKTLKALSILALFALLSLNSSEAQEPAGTASPRPVVLQGFAEHSERLPAVEPQLQAGAIFNDSSLPKCNSNNRWYWIPGWYAGQKHVDTETVLQDFDFQSGRLFDSNRVIKNKQDLCIGFQPDRNGEIWEFDRAPYSTTVEGDKYFTVMYVRKREPVSVSKDRVIIRLEQTSVLVLKKSRKISKTIQEEQINICTPSGEGMMNMQTSIKTFAEDGSPLLQEMSNRTVLTKAPFTPVDFYNGKDMKALFRDFMLANNYGNLLPDSLRQPPAQSSP